MATRIVPEADAREVLRAAVRFAVLAPSSHNSQPWVFRLAGADAVELYADRARALPVVDPDGRELVVSCGAALFHLRAALRGLGFEGDVTPLPDPADPDFLARVRLGARHAPTAADRALVAAMPRRRTNRREYERRPVPERVVSLLVAAAREEGAWLVPLDTPAQRDALADAVAEADRRQEADPLFRRELAAWMRPNGDGSRDGMSGQALGIPGVLSHVAPAAVAALDLGAPIAVRDGGRVRRAPEVAALMTAGDGPGAWLAAGQAVARVALTACAAGVATSYLNQPLEVPQLRRRVAAIAREALSLQSPAGRDVMPETAAPQMLLRLGYAPDTPAAPRRALDEVLR
jgi:hypothetical protein